MLDKIKSVLSTISYFLVGILAAVGLYYKQKEEAEADLVEATKAQVDAAQAQAQQQQDTQAVKSADGDFEAAVKDFQDKGGKV